MADKDPCLIGSQITIKGHISGNQDLVVEGRIEGKIALQNRLTVEESAVVEADVDVVDLSLKGDVRGELLASRSAVLHATSRVSGTLRAPRLVIEDGAHFHGTIEMEVELPAGLKAEAR